MQYCPHKYQQYATDYILEHPISAVWLECGLGKTVITLTALEELIYDLFEVSKVLIIAPLRVAKVTWPDEISKWDHLNDLTYSVAVGNEAERLSALNEKVNIHIINRENVDWLVNKSGVPFDYDMVIIDELSSFKSHQSKRFKALLKVRPKVKRIVGLTGTPASNSYLDLFAQYRLLDCGERLGRYISNYRQKYFKPDKFNGPVVYSYKLLPGAEKLIYSKIEDITISMKSEDYLDLPECITNEVIVKLDDIENEKYKMMKKEMVADIEDSEINAINAAALGNKLLQMANGAVYDDKKSVHRLHNHKLDALEDLIEGANGKPVLVVYWFKHDLERIRERFNVREIKTGKDIEDWNNGEIPIAVIHPQASAHGINLQKCNSTMIFFSLFWSLELYQQVIKRIHRLGRKETVIIHHIICKGTIDEQVMKALKMKDSMQDSLINAVKAELGGSYES